MSGKRGFDRLETIEGLGWPDQEAGTNSSHGRKGKPLARDGGGLSRWGPGKEFSSRGGTTRGSLERRIEGGFTTNGSGGGSRTEEKKR